MGQTECKGCSTSDPTVDTVNINIPGSTLLTDDGAGKTSPKHGVEKEQEGKQEAEEHARREAEVRREREEQERLRFEAEAEARRLEQERAEELRLREEAARVEQEAVNKLAAEEALRVRKSEEERQRAAEDKAHREAQQKSGAFLKSHGFQSAIHPKTSCMKVSYPLHVAVRENKAEVVSALLRCGAEKHVKNRAGQTPLDVAQKLNKNASHQAVITALSR